MNTNKDKNLVGISTKKSAETTAAGEGLANSTKGLVKSPVVKNVSTFNATDPFKKGGLVGRSPPIVENKASDKAGSQANVTRNITGSKLTKIMSNDDGQKKPLDVGITVEKQFHLRISELEKMCSDLKSQIHTLTEENKMLKKKQITKSAVEYCTDEEELTREIEWIVKRTGKKRKAEHSPEIHKEENSVEKLNVIKPKIANDKPIITRKNKPPPVILSNVVEYPKVNKILKEVQINYKVNMMNNHQLKINVEKEGEYRELTKIINEANLEWHTYENKLTRPIKVMARNLHPSCHPEDIKQELKCKGFKIIEVVNKIKKIKKNEEETIVKLPLFMLTFENTENIDKIYKIEFIQHMRVKIEALKKTNLIPQCKKCQRYGHTQKFCQRLAKCVKCAGSHLSTNCDKDKKVTPKCANCLEAHPANYRGCVVAKELQKRKKKVIQNIPKKVRRIHLTLNLEV